MIRMVLKRKRFWVILAVICLLVGSIPVLYAVERAEGNSDDRPNQTEVYYDRDAAKGYAYRWWDDRNPHYNDFSDSGGDCANFVSQALIAGGLSLHEGTNGDGYGIYPDSDRPSVYSNGTIPYCDYMDTHFREYQPVDYDRIYSAGEAPDWLTVGDPVIFGDSSDRHQHAMIVVWDGPDSIGLAGHTTDRWNITLEEELSYFESVDLYHINEKDYEGDDFVFEVTTSNLNVRAGPGVNDLGDLYQDIGDIHQGEKYIALDTETDSSGNTWYQFWFDDRAAWCAAEYDGNTYAQPTGEETYLDIDVGWYLNVRTGPGTEYTDLGEVYNDMRFYPFDDESGWYRFYWHGRDVWASGSYMTVVNYSSEEDDMVDGIDVSHWQGDIDWNSVYDGGYRFAFCKATEDTSSVDDTFTTNMDQGTDAGLYMGPYHFARPLDNSAEDEAQHFSSVIAPYMTDGYMRPVLDLENGSSMSKSELTNWVHEFMDTVEAETGYEPLIYTSSNYANNELESSVTEYDLWIAHWTYDPTASPDTGVWPDWSFWQYSNEGSVPGVSGDCDLDVFNGNMSDLEDDFVISEPAYLEVEIVEYDEEVVEGESVVLDATVSNTGGQETTQTIEFTVDQEVKDSAEVTLAGGEEQGVSFEWTSGAPGEYIVGVSSEDSEDEVNVTVLERVEEYTLTISAEEGGTTDPEPGNYTYEEGDNVTVTALPDENWTFSHWEGDAPEGEEEHAEIDLTMDGNKTLTAHFQDEEPVVEYELTVGSTEGGEVVEPGEGTFTYEEGTAVDLEAVPEESYHFVEWTGDNESVEDTKRNMTALTMNDDHTIEAQFEQEKDQQEDHELTIGSTEGGNVTVPGEGTFEHPNGTEIDLEAVSEKGYRFIRWVGDNGTIEEVSSNETTITMDSDKEITAHFAEDEEPGEAQFEITIISPEDGKEFEKGEDVVVEYRVENTGDVEGERDIEFYADGELIETEEQLSLGPEESYEGEFVWEPENEGEAELMIRNVDEEVESTVDVTVSIYEKDPGVEDDSIFSWWLILLAVIVIIAVIGAVLWAKRGSDHEEEASGDEEISEDTPIDKENS